MSAASCFFFALLALERRAGRSGTATSAALTSSELLNARVRPPSSPPRRSAPRARSTSRASRRCARAPPPPSCRPGASSSRRSYARTAPASSRSSSSWTRASSAASSASSACPFASDDLDLEESRDRVVLAAHLVGAARRLETSFDELVAAHLAVRRRLLGATRHAERRAQVAPRLLVVGIVLQQAEGVPDRLRAHRHLRGKRQLSRRPGRDRRDDATNCEKALAIVQ